MITFDDVRRTTGTTFFFFPDGMHDMLAYFLEAAGIPATEYCILSYAETRKEYPNLNIPMIPGHPSLAGNPDAYDEPLTMVSHMNVEDMERKLWEIDESDEAEEWYDQRIEEFLAKERERDERLKGWGPGLTRESEEVR